MYYICICIYITPYPVYTYRSYTLYSSVPTPHMYIFVYIETITDICYLHADCALKKGFEHMKKGLLSTDGPEEGLQTWRRSIPLMALKKGFRTEEGSHLLSYNFICAYIDTHMYWECPSPGQYVCEMCTQPFSRASSLWNSTLNKRSNAQLVFLLHSLPAQVIERSKLSAFRVYAYVIALLGVPVLLTYTQLEMVATQNNSRISSVQDQHTTNSSLMVCLGVPHFPGIRVQLVDHMILLLPWPIVDNDITTCFTLLLDVVVDKLGKVPPHCAFSYQVIVLHLPNNFSIKNWACHLEATVLYHPHKVFCKWYALELKQLGQEITHHVLYRWPHFFSAAFALTLQGQYV